MKNELSRNLLEYFKMSLFSFAMICLICKMLVLLKNYLNYLKNIFKCFFKKYNKRLCSFSKKFF